MTGRKRFAAGALAAGLIGGAAMASGQLTALTTQPHGNWQLKVIGAPTVRSVCAPDPLQLIQLNHAGPACARFTIVDAADHVVVQYNCGPRGYGRTTIAVTRPGQIRLDTQGISPEGRPFDASYEGQFTGPCAGSPR